MALHGGRLRNISDCVPDKLIPGDGVAVTFTLSYVEGVTDWYPEYMLIDIVRIANRGDEKPGAGGGFWARASGQVSRKALRVGEVVDGVYITLGHCPNGTN